MKKLFALFLPLVCVLFLLSCNQQEQQKTTETTETTDTSDTDSPIEKVQLAELDIATLTVWLDNEGFVPALSQFKLIEKMGSYMYNGKPIEDATIGYYYDGPHGGGYDAGCENFGFSNDYTASEDGESAVYTNSFYTKVPLDGLTLPFGIEFDDSLSNAMLKIGFAVRLPADFAPDDETDNAMTLYEDERYTVIFKDLTYSKDQITTVAPYELIFTENYTYVRGTGRVSNVTRTIKLAFTSDESVLCKFNIKIQENYNLK